MNGLSQHMAQRAEARLEAQKRQERGDVSLTEGTPEERLIKFDKWVRAELLARLVWPDEEGTRQRLVEQCRLELDQPVLELWRRGWLLDGKRLATHIRNMLDAVGAAQKAGKVQDFWPYYKASVRRYVGANAEEIQYEARSAGVHVGNVLSAFGINRAPTQKSIPELVAQRADETLREKLARERRKNDQKTADKAQLKLL